jgi:hypothetical protein
VIGIKAELTKFVDYNAPPGWVECHFIDAWGKEHTFIEKVPVVTADYLDENSDYPQSGHLGCEIIEERFVDKGKIVKVTTEKP